MSAHPLGSGRPLVTPRRPDLAVSRDRVAIRAVGMVGPLVNICRPRLHEAPERIGPASLLQAGGEEVALAPGSPQYATPPGRLGHEYLCVELAGPGQGYREIDMTCAHDDL